MVIQPIADAAMARRSLAGHLVERLVDLESIGHEYVRATLHVYGHRFLCRLSIANETFVDRATRHVSLDCRPRYERLLATAHAISRVVGAVHLHRLALDVDSLNYAHRMRLNGASSCITDDAHSATGRTEYE